MFEVALFYYTNWGVAGIQQQKNANSCHICDNSFEKSINKVTGTIIY